MHGSLVHSNVKSARRCNGSGREVNTRDVKAIAVTQLRKVRAVAAANVEPTGSCRKPSGYAVTDRENRQRLTDK